MVDVVSRSKRSKMMAGIKGSNTRPEIAVRALLRAAGHRIRLHQRQLPGSPDIVLPKHKTAIFVHGCFWHRHPNCKFAYHPKTRKSFWQEKFEKNVARDKKVEAELRGVGWRVLVVWECTVRDPKTFPSLVRRFETIRR